EPCLDGVLHVGGGVVVGQRGRVPEERRVRLQRQVVAGQVLGAEGQRRVEVGQRAGDVLARQRVHQVEVHAIEVLLRDGDRAARLGAVVDAAQRGEVGVV